MTFLTGFLISIAGVLLIVFREKVQRFTGDIGFAEQYLGSGGTFTFLFLLGIAVFIMGLLWSTGSLQEWFYTSLGRYFGYS
jgi:hypothetical protein